VHIHIPDGVLPVWLWTAGYVVILALVALAVRTVRGQERKGVLAAVMVAVMLVAQSIPLGVPYHINPSALTGIIPGFADVVYVLARGQLIYRGRPLELFTRPELLEQANIESPPLIEVLNALRESIASQAD